jgi:membrane protease subunit HflC
MQVSDVPTQELLIRDRDEKTGTDKPLPLTFDVYVCWRIEDPATAAGDSVDQFVRSFGTLDKAESFLRSQIISRLKVELSDIALAELINPDPARLRTAELLQRIRTQPPSGSAGADGQSLEQRARQVGIQVVDIRLRRFNHPLQVRDEIFAKIREQRRREANNYRLQGEELAAAIRAEGELESRKIRADAEAEKKRLEGKAQADALRILNDAHKEAPELYRIVRLLESYKSMFADDKTQLILSLDHPLLALFKDLPRLNSPGKANGEKKVAAPIRPEER